MYTAASIFSGAAGTPIDRLREAIDALEVADFTPTGIILHPSDWKNIQLLKDAENRFLVGAPQGANPAMILGLPLVTTAAMTSGKFLLGDFSSAAIIYDRQVPRLDISYSDEDNFTRNLATLRVEERLALAVSRPEALLRGDVEES